MAGPRPVNMAFREFIDNVDLQEKWVQYGSYKATQIVFVGDSNGAMTPFLQLCVPEIQEAKVSAVTTLMQIDPLFNIVSLCAS